MMHSSRERQRSGGAPRPGFLRASTLGYTSNKPDWMGAGFVAKDASQPVEFEKSEGEASEKVARDGDADDDNLEESLFRKGLPEVRRSEGSTLLELFFDLWFVATLNVFTSAHDIAKPIDLASYVEFEFLLWTTWFLVAIFDVRFLTNSWIERVSRAIHLAIMIAFAESAPYFRASQQIQGVALALALTLLVSRLVLIGQYSIIFWHLRYYLDARKPVMAVLILHVMTACFYIVAAAFSAAERNPYTVHLLAMISFAEVVSQIAITMKTDFTIISFEKSHLAERLNLLTLIILGEGIIGIARDVALIEQNDAWNPWSSSMWLIFSSGVIAIYVIFQIYHDFVHPNDMAHRRQLLWAVIHAPFHFILLIVMEGINQFIVWWRLFEILDGISFRLLDALRPLSGAIPTGTQVAHSLNQTAMGVLDKFPPSRDTSAIVNAAIGRIDLIAAQPESAFAAAARANLTVEAFSGAGPAAAQTLLDDTGRLLTTLTQDVFSNFQLEAFAPGTLEVGFASTQEALSRAFNLVFVYAFIAAGLMLLLLTTLHAVSKRRGWTSFNILRSVLVVALGLGLALAPIAITRRSLYTTIWALPSICIVLIIVLVITHVPHPPGDVEEECPLNAQRHL